MGVLSDLIEGTVRVTETAGEATGEKLRGIFTIAGVIIILLFLLIIFAFEPMTAMVLGVALILGGAYVLANNDGDGLV